MTAYKELEGRFKKMSVLAGANAILNWDNAVMMPDGGAVARAEQMATLRVMQHEMIIDPAMQDLINEAEQAEDQLDDWQKANLRELKQHWRQATCLDSSLVEAFSRATSDCEMTWRDAREADDFSLMSDKLEEVFNLTRQMADALSETLGLSPYDALLNQFEPGCRQSMIDPLFAELEDFLPSFLEEVLEKQASEPAIIVPEGPFDQSVQKDLGLQLMADLGFDFNRGRLDTSHHPFTGGIPDDVRLTTRYEDDDFTQSLMGTLHETGHALYEQNLPAKWRGLPVGEARGMALHESQSLLVEMQLSRGKPYLAYLYPKLVGAFGGKGEAWSLENITRLYHKVERGFIRVDADEVTYPLHVILRYRLETALLSGDLSVKDLPGAWNDGMQSLLGITPPDDKLGVLQDIHWPGGAVGYFPTYTLGALAAAQIFQTANEKIPDLDQKVEAGQFGELMGWLKQNIHEKGCFLTTDELMAEVTGSPLKADAYKTHVKARYLGG